MFCITNFEYILTCTVDLHVDKTSAVVWNKQAFRDLVVEEKTKELVKALVTNHLLAAQGTDSIDGKGNGLILLLHGGPGTGKTFTAEGVAEYAEKPLFRVTCGDIGTQAEVVEKKLESVLHLGKMWDCGKSNLSTSVNRTDRISGIA
jgi:AAA+ superfamily predicted ATPase